MLPTLSPPPPPAPPPPPPPHLRRACAACRALRPPGAPPGKPRGQALSRLVAPDRPGEGCEGPGDAVLRGLGIDRVDRDERSRLHDKIDWAVVEALGADVDVAA